VVELVPNHAQALDALGTYHLGRGERDAARDCFTRCLAANPRDPFGARLKLAYMDEQAPPEKFPDEWVRQTYETKARTWDEDAARPGHEFLGPRHVREAFERWAGARVGMDILDLGCGTGACGEFLRARARRLIGVDLSDAMLQVARSKRLYDELHTADVVAYLNTVAGGCDAIVASGVVIFFGDLAPLFAAAQRALRPGGAFIFSTYRAAEGDYVVRANFHFAHSEDYLRRVASAAHLNVARIDAVVHEIDHGVAQDGYLVELRKA
jgi:predicted TPR repeat methyltransferase